MLHIVHGFVPSSLEQSQRCVHPKDTSRTVGIIGKMLEVIRGDGGTGDPGIQRHSRHDMQLQLVGKCPSYKLQALRKMKGYARLDQKSWSVGALSSEA